MTASVRIRRGAGPAQAEPSVVIVAEPPEARSRLRLSLVIGGTLIALLLCAYGGPATYMWGRVLPGTHVADVQIGGLSETVAIDRVRERFDGRDQQSLELTLAGRRVGGLDPREAGLTIDIQATVADAQTGFPSPVGVWQALTGGRDLPPRISLNNVKLVQRVRRIAKMVDRPVREGSIVYQGVTPKVVPPKDGLALDRDAAAEAIKRAFINASGSVELPVSAVHPRAGEAAFVNVVAVARRAVAAPIVLANGGRKVRLSPSVIAANLDFEADERGAVHPRFDAKKAIAGLETKLVGFAETPREAGFVIENGAPKLVRARSGKGVDTAALASAVTKVITGGGSRTIPVSLAVTEPELTDRDALKLGVREEVGHFTTNHPCCAARVTNIHKGADLLDGLLVKPGQTFSFNEVLGEPDAARGFVPAQMIEGDHLAIGMGGGLSQLATTLYNAVFEAGLEDVEHTANPFHVLAYPAGRDAAVSYPDQDLKWRNNTRYGVLVKASHTPTTVTVSMWSTKRFDSVGAETSGRSDITQQQTRHSNDPSCIPMEGRAGFTITVTRTFSEDGKIVKRDRPETTVYDPQQRLICEQGRLPTAEGSVKWTPPSGKPPGGLSATWTIQKPSASPTGHG